MLIKGLQKQEPALTARHLPFISDLLSLCIRSLSSGYISPMVDLMLESMFLLAFFGFLKCSKFVPTSSAYNPSLHPSLYDITIHTPIIISMISVKPTLNSAQFNRTLLWGLVISSWKHAWDGSSKLSISQSGLKRVLPDQPNRQHSPSALLTSIHLSSTSNTSWISIKPLNNILLWHSPC